MTTNPYTSPLTLGESAPPKTGHFRQRLISWLTVLAILMLVASLLLPFRRGGARPEARRMSCVNNLHNIALALKNYEVVYGALPPAYTVDPTGKPLHSWRTLILPYLEQKALYDTIDLSKPWDDPVNKLALETPLKIYLCPESVGPSTHTTYLAVVTSNSCLQPAQPRRLRAVTDSHELTLIVADVNSEQAVPWMSPTDTSEEWLLNLKNVTKLPHPHGALGASVSGQALTVKKNSSAEALRALISIAGNDDEVAREEF